MDGNAGGPAPLNDPKKTSAAPRSLVGRTNRDWWPNQIAVDILHQQGRTGDPMGEGFSYAEAFKALDYAAVKRDLTALMKVGESPGELQRVVMVQWGPGRAIGFVTQENANVPGLGTDESLVAVYLPMSYQIGGYTLYLPRDRIQPTDLTVEAAMRIVLTGGLQNQ